MMRKRFLIFDFDGTIADSFLVMVRSYNDVARTYGLKQLDEGRPDLLKQRDMKDHIRSVNLSFLQLPCVAYLLRKRYAAYAAEIKPVKGIRDVIRALHENGNALGLATSNNRKNTYQFLSDHDLTCFDVVKTGRSIFGKHRILSKLKKRWDGDPNSIFYVGDEVRDIQAAQRAGIASIAVSWGFNARSLLEQQNPTRIIDDPRDLIF